MRRDSTLCASWCRLLESVSLQTKGICGFLGVGRGSRARVTTKRGSLSPPGVMEILCIVEVAVCSVNVLKIIQFYTLNT